MGQLYDPTFTSFQRTALLKFLGFCFYHNFDLVNTEHVYVYGLNNNSQIFDTQSVFLLT